MNFHPPLVHGHLIKRYKRFLADVRLDDGTITTAHCTNSGSMKSCLEEGAEVYISDSMNPKRKTRYTWEMIKIGEDWVGINTANPNKLAFEIIWNNLLPRLSGYTKVVREVKFDDSRFDIFAQNSEEKCYIEVKNVTLKDGMCARFPDAVTTRGQKHLDTLIKAKVSGFRAVMLYIIQRCDVKLFTPAFSIDPVYAEKLRLAIEHGVEIIPLQVKVTPTGIEPVRVLEYQLHEKTPNPA
ncbi:DNA/RNA nuclease SfsA [Chitinispirillales bacterium ANBcel5]|uniref:DNA/RNA nuclease SfsA n=1 Tax=Cellulosispirillum alkaliphilum TaxID=3039283 RepID=UPI002A551A04|nr:DNA/RNA nuclease SfsA [Chitinispirillales bacterium ANBcel5]